MSIPDSFERIVDSGIIGIVRGVDTEEAVSVVEALSRGGIEAIEITADRPGAIDCLQRVSAAFGDDVSIGVGTVLDSETARAAQLAGAEYIVTPTVDTDVIETANRYGTPAIPGVMTPTEAQTAIEAGADLCKLFPAATVGPGHVRAINGPLPQVPLVPTGGISLDNAAEFFEAGAVALGVGSALVDRGLIETGDYERLTENAAAFSDIAGEYA